jgi:ABC-type Zn uptake system ZnuABC Zn-binding protein ZnuA
MHKALGLNPNTHTYKKKTRKEGREKERETETERKKEHIVLHKCMQLFCVDYKVFWFFFFGCSRV